MSNKNKRRSPLLESLKETIPLFIVSIIITIFLLMFIVHFAPQAFQSVPVDFDSFMPLFVIIIISGVFLGLVQRILKVYSKKKKEIKYERKRHKQNNKF